MSFSNTLGFSSFFFIICNRLIIGSIILLIAYSFTKPYQEMLLLNLLIVIGCFIIYLEKEYYIKNLIKILKYLYIQDKYFLFTMCCIS